MSVRILVGDWIEQMRTLPDASVQCVGPSSPPYLGLRSYLPAGHPDKAKEVGSEPTPDEFVAAMLAGFREARRVLRDDGVFILNLGDSMSGSGKGPTGKNGIGDQHKRQGFTGVSKRSTLRNDGRAHKGPYDGEKMTQPILGSVGRVRSTRCRLRADLAPEQVAYVLEELAKARTISSATQEARP